MTVRPIETIKARTSVRATVAALLLVLSKSLAGQPPIPQWTNTVRVVQRTNVVQAPQNLSASPANIVRFRKHVEPLMLIRPTKSLRITDCWPGLPSASVKCDPSPASLESTCEAKYIYETGECGPKIVGWECNYKYVREPGGQLR